MLKIFYKIKSFLEKNMSCLISFLDFWPMMTCKKKLDIFFGFKQDLNHRIFFGFFHFCRILYVDLIYFFLQSEAKNFFLDHIIFYSFLLIFFTITTKRFIYYYNQYFN